MPSAKTKLGRRGEDQAARFLRRLGHKIIARNYLCPIGEIDLVTIDGDTLVFVEVKSKLAGDLGGFTNITAAKQHKLVELAGTYLQQHQPRYTETRFDAVEVEYPDASLKRPVIRHLEDAFRA